MLYCKKIFAMYGRVGLQPVSLLVPVAKLVQVKSCDDTRLTDVCNAFTDLRPALVLLTDKMINFANEAMPLRLAGGVCMPCVFHLAVI